jgi:hypothetical protein
MWVRDGRTVQSHVVIRFTLFHDHGFSMFTASMKLGAVMMLGVLLRRRTLAGPGACR